METTKICSKCEQEKELYLFINREESKDGKDRWCKECHKKAASNYRENNRDKCRANSLKYNKLTKENDPVKFNKWHNDYYHRNWLKKLMVKYNLSDIEIFALFVNQNNECPGCKRSLDTVRFCIDHNHETGKVRGVLCDACNTAIGMAREKREVLENLSSYLISNGE